MSDDQEFKPGDRIEVKDAPHVRVGMVLEVLPGGFIKCVHGGTRYLWAPREIRKVEPQP